MFQLSGRQRAALGAICDTFAPGVDGLPSATDHGVVEAIEEAVGRNPREAERKQTAQLLGLWNTRLLGTVAGIGPRRFASLNQATRERALLSWGDSRTLQRRAAFQALRKASLLMYYMKPGSDGSSPMWAHAGFEGPPGTRDDHAEPAPVKSRTPAGPEELECDVVVVGSGAGGGTAAGVLGAAGLSVVVVEAGEHVDESEFDGAEYEGYRRLYLNGGAMATDDAGCGLLAGAALGGGTLVNYSTAYRTPDHVRKEWGAAGVPAFAGEEYERSMEVVSDRLGVNHEHTWPSARDAVLQEGATALGWKTDIVPRNAHGCPRGGEACATCGFGCPYGAKQSTLRTWLVDASSAGADILVRTRAERVIVEAGAARGVTARTHEGHEVSIKARAVVVACGALHTPALLKRSGLRNPNVGRHLHVHPAAAVFGVLDREVKPWQGTMQAVHVDEHLDLDGRGYGVKYQTAPLHPGFYVSFAPWRSAAHHAALIEELSHTAVAGVLVRDREAGEVKVGRDGEPVVRYRLSPYDAAHMRKGIEGAAQMLEAVGARRTYTSHARWVARENGGSIDELLGAGDACGYGPGQLVINAFHLLGSARMGGSAESSACGPEGETWDVRDLVVCDASAFPTASGVNPMLTIESIAHMNASRLAARLA